MWSFPVNVCQFLFYHTCSTTSFSTLSEAEIKTVDSSSIQLFTYKYHLYLYYPALQDRYTHTYAPNRGTNTSFFPQTFPFCLNQYLEIFKSYCDYVIDVYNRHILFFPCAIFWFSRVQDYLDVCKYQTVLILTQNLYSPRRLYKRIFSTCP